MILPDLPSLLLYLSSFFLSFLLLRVLVSRMILLSLFLSNSFFFFQFCQLKGEKKGLISKLEHERKRKLLTDAIKKNLRGGTPIALKKDTTNLFRFRDNTKKRFKIDCRPFNRVIDVDTENQYFFFFLLPLFLFFYLFV